MDCEEPGLSTGQWGTHQEFQSWALFCLLGWPEWPGEKLVFFTKGRLLRDLSQFPLGLSPYIFFSCKTFIFFFFVLIWAYMIVPKANLSVFCDNLIDCLARKSSLLSWNILLYQYSKECLQREAHVHTPRGAGPGGLCPDQDSIL